MRHGLGRLVPVVCDGGQIDVESTRTVAYGIGSVASFYSRTACLRSWLAGELAGTARRALDSTVLDDTVANRGTSPRDVPRLQCNSALKWLGMMKVIEFCLGSGTDSLRGIVAPKVPTDD